MGHGIAVSGKARLLLQNASGLHDGSAENSVEVDYFLNELLSLESRANSFVLMMNDFCRSEICQEAQQGSVVKLAARSKRRKRQHFFLGVAMATQRFFVFTPGKWSNLRSKFFRWVGSTTKQFCVFNMGFCMYVSIFGRSWLSLSGAKSDGSPLVFVMFKSGHITNPVTFEIT